MELGLDMLVALAGAVVVATLEMTAAVSADGTVAAAAIAAAKQWPAAFEDILSASSPLDWVCLRLNTQSAQPLAGSY